MRARPLWAVVAVDAAAWALVQVGAGYVGHRLPDRLLDRDGWLLAERGWERGGRFYVETARIRRWKRFLPEAGAVFAGGLSKRELWGREPAQLAGLARETRRAEVVHWLMLVPTPVFVAGNPAVLAPFMVLYAAAVNLPCIAAQRYNRIRLRRAAARAGRPGQATVVEGRGGGPGRPPKGSRVVAAARRRSSFGTSGTSMPYGSPP